MSKTIFIGIAIAALILLALIRRGIRKLKVMREIMEERLEKNEFKKREDPFGRDYFKTAGQSQASATTAKTATRQPSQESPRAQKATDQTARQTTEQPKRQTTSHGNVTITVSGDNNEANRKIFADHEGEYVEFTEE